MIYHYRIRLIDTFSLHTSSRAQGRCPHFDGTACQVEVIVVAACTWTCHILIKMHVIHAVEDTVPYNRRDVTVTLDSVSHPINDSAQRQASIMACI